MSGVTFYERCLLPPLTHVVMGLPKLAEHRRRLLREARGLTVEVGFGSGRNIGHFRSEVSRVIGIDPSAALLAIAARSSAASPHPVHRIRAVAERLPIADGVADTAVACWTLCSVERPDAALAEVRRVLKPTGRLLFVEHGLADDDRTCDWQSRLTPAWRRMAGGCHLNRPIDALILQARFRMQWLQTGYVGRPRFLSYFFTGCAVPV